MYDWKWPDFNSDFLGLGPTLHATSMGSLFVTLPPPPPPPPPQTNKVGNFRFGDVCLSTNPSEIISLYPLVIFDGIKRLSIEIVQESVFVFLSPHSPTMIMGYNNQPGVHRS